MTVFAQSWFFHSPGKDSQTVADRVRQSLWASGLYSLWLDPGSAASPFKVTGNHGEKWIKLEWEPGVWLRLRTQDKGAILRDHLAWVLGRAPSLRFTDRHGCTVWEWHLQGSSERWREISGNPIYQDPYRFD